jgi:putative ABC transport system permease protein
MAFLRDLRFGVRILTRTPSYAAAALTVVALGIGATTAVFSVVRGVLLQPLPYREPNRIVLFRADLPGYAHQPALTAEEKIALQNRVDLFDDVAALDPSEGNLTAPDDMQAVSAASITENLLQTLGVTPYMGRSVSHLDFGRGWVSGIDISYELWQRRFHADPDILSTSIDVNNIPMTVVGVLPRDFRLYLGPGVDVAQRLDILYPRGKGYDDDPYRGQVVIARLRRGVTPGTAQAAVDSMMTAFVAAHPASYRTGAARIFLSTLDQDAVSDVKPALLALAGAVAFVLLVACANLANLLLARASARSRELALRASIGASRGQIARQLIAEGLVVGALGAGGGILLAQWCVEGLLLLAPATLPRREAIAVDASLAGFAIACSLLCTLVVSLVPAWHATRSDLVGMLKQDRVASRHAGATRGVLVASQLAFSLMLLVGAGLMTRAFIGMRSMPLGFDPHNAATLNVHLQVQLFNTGTLEAAKKKRLAFYHELVDTVRSIPGVDQAGVGLPAPLSGPAFLSQRFTLGSGDRERQSEGVIAFAGYLESLRVPLVSGRYFATADDDRPVVMLDQRLAEALWPRASAVGRQMTLLSTTAPPQRVEVVGVVAHVQMRGLREAGLPQIWVTYGSRSYSDLNIVVRGKNAAAVMPAVERAVQAMGPGRPVHDVRTMDDYVADASADTRFALFVLGVFAALAVALTSVGIWGVVAYSVARRAREIAVRRALGASARDIMILVMREGAVWIGVGLAAGALGARGLSRSLESLLFQQVRPTDALTFVAVGALLTIVALLAAAIPAIRAVHVDPMLALRSD